MPRDVSNVYNLPAGVHGAPGTTIESAKYNDTIDDIAQDLNTARPVSAGGTGATNAPDARTNLGVATAIDAAIDDIDTITGAIHFTGVISPTTLAASQDNYNPTGLADASRVRLTASTAVSITGLAAQSTGRRIAVENVGTSTITFLGNNAASVAANRLLIPKPLNLLPGQCAELEYDGTSVGWRSLSPITSRSVVGGYKNLTILVTSAIAVDIDADAITLEDAFGESLRVLGVNLTASIAASGANGLDTGAEAANTWYAAWVIYNPTTNTIAGLLSLSATAPTMPADYTFKARVGWVRNDASSNLYRTIQKGADGQYIVGTNPTTARQMATGSAGNPAASPSVAVATGAFVPPTASAIRVWIFAGEGDITIVAPNSSYGAYNSSTNPPPIGIDQPAASGQDGTTLSGFMMLESTNIFWASSGGGGDLYCLGWVDNL